MERAPLFVPSAEGCTAGKWPRWDLGPSGSRVQARADMPELHEGLMKCWCLCGGNTRHSQLITSLSLGIKYSLLYFCWARTWRKNLGSLKDNQLVPSCTARWGRGLTPGELLLPAKVSQVKSWFHFPQRVTVPLITAINCLPGRKDS